MMTSLLFLRASSFFATASQDEEVCLWDKRKMSDEKRLPLARLQHQDFVHCAHFSPRDGGWLVAVGQDSYIDMYDSSSLVRTAASDTVVTLPHSIRVPHKTETGTPVKLRPAWDPKRKDRFVIGCLDGSARLKIFHAGNPRAIRALRDANLTGTTDVVTVYHPHHDLVASGYLSGQVSLWRGKPKSRLQETYS
jgi:WD40 repeat protein